MDSFKLAELTAAQFDANRARLQTQQAFFNFRLTAIGSEITAEENRLLVIQAQQERLNLLIELNQLQKQHGELWQKRTR